MAVGYATDKPSRAMGATGIDVGPGKWVTVGVIPSRIGPRRRQRRSRRASAMMSSYTARTELRNQQRLARLTIQMAYDVKLEHAGAANRTIDRMISALGVLAAMVTVYDLWFLAMQ